jgi:zinc transport system ATP-binding protein
MSPDPGDAPDLPVLSLNGVTIRRGRDAILSDVSLAVARGSIHVIAGPNGAGKSTLLMAALGQISFLGTITARWQRGGRIGYVPQSFVVDRTLPVTVSDFLALTRQRRPISTGIGRKTRAHILTILERIGLADVADRPLSVLSGGELRRVLLAHALDPLPELLMLDEPGTGLDLASSRWLEEMLLTVRQRDGVTVLMVSHDLAQAQRIADRVTVLDRVVIVDGTAAEALERHVPGFGA